MHRLKKNIFLFCAYNMVNISAKTFSKCCIHSITDKEKNLWLRIKDIGKKLSVKNIFDLVDKEIKGKRNTNNPTEQKIRECRRHRLEFIEDTKFMYAHECIMIPAIMHCRVATPKSIEFRSKLGFNPHHITLTKEQFFMTTD